ncbi:hypothetical protein ACIP93_19505 [Streptomyces sp. NPDC088745]
MKLGMVSDNIRKRADKLPAERRAELDAVDHGETKHDVTVRGRGR